MVGAKLGFYGSAGLMLVIWAIVTLTAFWIIDVNLACSNEANSFNSMARKTLGKVGQVVVWIASLCLMYALLSAYTAGATVLLKALFQAVSINVSDAVCATLFVILLGGVVFWSTRAVDYINRWFMGFKGLFLIVSIALLLPQVSLENIKLPMENAMGGAFLAAMPIFICAFGFHLTIPSIRNYIGSDKKILRKIIVYSTTVPLIIYLCWLWVMQGIIPMAGSHSFAEIAKTGNSVDKLMAILAVFVSNPWAVRTVKAFSNISMTTSFLGVALGLFDFLADGFRRPNTRLGRSQTALLTFIPPLLFTLFYPKGFMMALSYASIFVIILIISLPALMRVRLSVIHKEEN